MKSILTLTALIVCIQAVAQNNPPKEDTAFEKIFLTVQVQAVFPGGPNAWVKYLQTNLRADLANRAIRLRRHQHDSTQTVIVSFLVDQDGNITEAQADNEDEVSPILANEAVRVIQNGPKWKPATQNGQNVIYRQKQSISFQVVRE